MLCVAVASLGLALHGLRDGVTAGNLLTNRPSGLLTQQPNLFGGFLGMHALLCLFVARSRELTWMERSFLVGAAFVMVLTLVFTLSRGAWLAFGLAAVMVGALTNRSAVLALVVFVFIGSRWAPEEATQRANRTLAALEESRDSSLEEALDNSTALRVLQWETFPALLRDSPLWGTGVGTYPQRLEQHTGISRGAHATIVQIGTEMGLLGLLGYLGLFGSIALACLSRARRAASATFHHAAGLGLLAATACLFLADFSGTRFPTHTVTTYYWLLLGAFLGSTDSVSAPPPSDDHTEPGWAAA
jgi:O-antigen ligase